MRVLVHLTIFTVSLKEVLRTIQDSEYQYAEAAKP